MWKEKQIMSNILLYSRNMLKLQILLIVNNVRNAYYDNVTPDDYIIDDEIQSLMAHYELVEYKKFIVHKNKKELLDSLTLNSENVGKILGYVNYTHFTEKINRFSEFRTVNEVAFRMNCDNYIVFTEIALIDFDNFSMDNMIKHMQELEEIYQKVLCEYGYKNIQYQVMYHEKLYDENELYKSLIDKVPIEKRIEIII